MTVSTTASTVTLAGNGAATVFPYPFRVLSAGDMKVDLISPTGSVTRLSAGYTVSGVGSTSGGSVTYPTVGSPLATGSSIRLSRELSVTQESRIGNQGSFLPQTHEDALDKLTMICQQFPTKSDLDALRGDVRGTLASCEFVGTGAQTVFDLTITVVGGSKSLLVAVDANVQATSSYSVAGTLLTFSEAPPLGALIDVRAIGEALETVSPAVAASAAAAAASAAAASGSATSSAGSATSAASSATSAATSATASAASATAAASSAALVSTSSVTATGGTTARSLAARFADAISVKDFEAVGDGTTNDTTNFQAALTACRNLFVPAGTYSVSNLTMPANTNLTLAAGATIQRRAASTGELLTIGNDCVVTGAGTIDGNSSVVAGNLDTIKSNGTSRITIEGIRLSNTCGTGWAWNINVGDHLVMRSCRIDSTNYGIRAWKGRYVTIDDNTFANVIFQSVLGDGDTVRYGKALVISNNRFRSSGGIAVYTTIMSVWPGAVDDGSGLTYRATAPVAADADDYDHNQPFYVGVEVIDNTFFSCPTYGITVRAEQVVISRNVIDGCSYSGVVPQARHVTVSDNVIKNCTSVGIDLGNCSWVTVTGNIIEDCHDIGIEVTCVSYGTITGNVVKNCGVNTNAPIRVGNGVQYSLYSPAVGCIIAHNTISCIAANIAGIYCSSSVNTLLSYVVTDNIIIDAAVPAVGYVPVFVGGGLNTFNLLVGVMASTTTGRTWFGATEATSALSINPGTTNANGVRFDGSNAAGGVVTLVAQGSDTNLDMRLAPKGSGVVRFGTLTANADVAITGYITIKDSAGTTRKLAVIS